MPLIASYIESWSPRVTHILAANHFKLWLVDGHESEGIYEKAEALLRLRRR